jgi:hypothetical protein
MFICRKRKPRMNTTKQWFPKENMAGPGVNIPTAEAVPGVVAGAVPSAVPGVNTPTAEAGLSSPPRKIRRVVRKITPKKKASLLL